MEVSEIITNTIQGEGRFSGYPAQFIRLAGCNARCKFCDTKASWDMKSGETMKIDEIVNKLDPWDSDSNIPIVVITGGDPTLQDCTKLIRILQTREFRVHVETHSLDAPWIYMIDHITFSPKNHIEYDMKKYIEILRKIDGSRVTLKVVIGREDESFVFLKSWASVWESLFSNSEIYLQCRTEQDGKIHRPDLIVEKFLEQRKSIPGTLRLSCQLHKILDAK